MVIGTDLEFICIKMVIDMKVIGGLEKEQVMENIFIMMVLSMTDIGIWVVLMQKVL